MTVLVTGVAGFIGSHVAHKLLEQGYKVIGIDNMNAYYDVNLKKARLKTIEHYDHFTFEKMDISDRNAIANLGKDNPEIEYVVHLAAQAGVRYSLENPFAYVDTNLVGHVAILELCRHLKNLKNFVYASSSSVYGSNTKMPFSVEDRTDTPISLYAATKKSDEVMSHCYAHLYRFPCTGLRYFTVYGPWGRPDMCAFIFLDAILKGKKMPVFNNGKMRRNFTYIDDIVAGTIGCMKKPNPVMDGEVPHRVYNIGNNKTEELMRFIEVLENEAGKKANISFEPIQPGDVLATVADIEATQSDFGFDPKTDIEVGLANFVKWYREFYKV